MKVKFKGWDCIAQFDYYYNGRVHILLIDAHTREPIANCTVNVPEEKQNDDEVFIKDYSENVGMVDSLVEANIINRPHRFITTGFVTIPVCVLVNGADSFQP